MMVRILSVLPGSMGLLCGIILILSLVGYSPDDSSIEVPIVPCTDSEAGCNIGMTGEDLSVPPAFVLLDIQLEVEWDEPERSWLAVVDAAAAEACPPTNGLTSCTEENIQKFIVSGGSAADGALLFDLDPGDYRFVTAGKDGSGLDSQEVTMRTSVHLDNFVEITLAVVTALLFAGAGEMAFPVRNILKRFKNS
ncbi:MAG: hypothetical protein QF911_04965 [Candidatus Thalassarchaeaceae archaeon]|nr:hypothetical protein [Candidatus Thalassarchaeaceae archaeon]